MTAMAWQTTGDVIEFLAAAGPYLRRERARNTVILSVTEAMRAQTAAAAPAVPAPTAATAIQASDLAARPLFGWWTDQAGDVAGAFMHTPPFPVVLTEVAPAAAADLAAVTMAARPIDGVNAYPEVAAAFADGWLAGHQGGRADVHRRQRLYRLPELVWPDPVPDGAARLADESDARLTADWFAAFADEVEDMGRDEDQSAPARAKIAYGGVTIWQVDGAPVSIACNTVPVAGMVRIGPVYTPPEARGHGYASVATAALSRRLLAEGTEEVVLYTDLANPVSNSIYQRIGYQSVEDRVVLAFSTD
jgi:RimJ/RimL family protein N-acetyltransferase